MARRRTQKPLISLRSVVYLSLGFLISLGVYVAYLDQQVAAKFEGKRFALPARVYASPTELYVGKKVTADALSQDLKQLRYHISYAPLESGQFRAQENTLTLHTRPFAYWDGMQQAQEVHIVFYQGKIKAMTSAEGNDIDLLRIEPSYIGGIYPNQGEDRILVRLDDVPQALVDALIAVEDKRFYQHHGVDPKAVLRAISTLFSNKRVQGGSTITQQLIKNFYLSSERTLRRKIKEVLMALLLERHYSKEEILETYINEVYFGQDKDRSIHGFGLASQFYFAKPIEHLNLHEAALLVGLLKGPIYYNPRKHPERAKQRRDITLHAMLDQNLIDKGAFEIGRAHV